PPSPPPTQPPVTPPPRTPIGTVPPTNIPTPNINIAAQGPKPEEVTFPRPDQTVPPPNMPQQTKPRGIASGEELKPFKLPKEISSGLSLPPNFQKNQIPTQLPPQKATKEEFPKPTQVTSSPQPSQASTVNTSPIESQPSISPPQEPAISSIQETSQENTPAILSSPTPPQKNTFSLNFVANIYKWWESKSPMEQKNLIGMFLVSLLLTILCVFTGFTAYQGVSPQPRRKKTTPPYSPTSQRNAK
ncbi:MAG: hypothetical protein N3G21_08980, partial [Candidatus Hydrogenedentes bacterium]|nr:hypothetical protein [Candidatus Hydrogenedentota bacterium]